MPVMNKDGDLFDERRHATRRKNNKPVDHENRKTERRKKDINASTIKKK